VQVLADAQRIIDIMDREDAQRLRAAYSDSKAFAAATALYSMAHKVLTHAAGPLGLCTTCVQLRNLYLAAHSTAVRYEDSGK
jgi:hypothetical protein